MDANELEMAMKQAGAEFRRLEVEYALQRIFENRPKKAIDFFANIESHFNKPKYF